MIPSLVLGLLTRLGLAGSGSVDPAAFTAVLDAWRDFYLLAGTAAVTLAGLLFVSLSLNLEHLLHETRAHLLHFARNTLLVYIGVLTISLMMLVPRMPMLTLGIELVITGTLLALFSIYATWRLVREHDAVFSRRHRLRRGLTPAAGGAFVILTGTGLLGGHLDTLYLLVSSVCMLLASAVWSSWDLLVGVARARREGLAR